MVMRKMKNIIENIWNWDIACFRNIFERSRQHANLTIFIKVMSHSGDGYLYPLVPLILMYYDTGAGFAFLGAGLVSFSIELPLYRMVKDNVKRNRPFVALEEINRKIMPPDEFSFPSGHTAAAFIMANLMSHFIPFATIPVFVWASIVGLSRIYLGVHFPTDVIAGMVIGLVSSAIGIFLFG